MNADHITVKELRRIADVIEGLNTATTDALGTKWNTVNLSVPPIKVTDANGQTTGTIRRVRRNSWSSYFFAFRAAA